MTDWLRWRRGEAGEGSDREWSDAREIADHVRRRQDDPEVGRRLKLRRRALVLGLGAVCLAGSVVAVVGEGGYADLSRLRDEIAELQAEIDRREGAVSRLEAEVRGLREEPLARERIAREQLGMVRPDEVDFLLPREPDPAWESDAASVGGGADRP